MSFFRFALEEHLGLAEKKNDLSENAIHVNLFLGQAIRKQPGPIVICFICEKKDLRRSEVRDENLKLIPGRVGGTGESGGVAVTLSVGKVG